MNLTWHRSYSPGFHDGKYYLFYTVVAVFWDPEIGRIKCVFEWNQKKCILEVAGEDYLSFFVVDSKVSHKHIQEMTDKINE